MLASSIWPRTGGGGSNSGLLSVHGPSTGKLLTRTGLVPGGGQGGGVVASDGSLRLQCDNQIIAVDADGRVRWRAAPERLLREHVNASSPKPGRPLRCSLPCALSDNRIALAVGSTAMILDGDRRVEGNHQVRLLDDTGASPNVDGRGRLIFTTIEGRLVCLGPADTRSEFTGFGYDLVPPAVYPDGSFGVSAYSRAGYSRVDLDGRVLWASGFSDTDMLASINSGGFAAVGSKNQRRSAILSPDGQLVANLDGASIFSNRPGGWISLASRRISALDDAGAEVWSRDVDADVGWGINQAIVDASGRIYVAERERVLALRPNGSELFTFRLPGPSGPLFAVADGTLAFIAAGDLWLLG